MNWVGGSRNRLVMRSDAKKQREFFEKRKMQQKLKHLGVAMPASSPADSGSGSMDLVTLFIVNQIAAKKANADPPKVAVLGSSKGGSKNKRNEPLVLPMSPCSPSQLSLVESLPQSSVQGVRKRKNVIPQGFKCLQLSPVLESAFSDNSASDYLPPITVPSSPFSSTSSASSGQGIFPLQLQRQKQNQTQPPAHYSPPHWNTSGLQHNTFQPFSQPRGMSDAVPWSCGSNLFQLETPTAAQILFRSPQPDKTEAGDCTGHTATFALSQPEDNDPILEFMLNQSETKQQFEEDIFSGFNSKEYEGGASHFGSAKSKICLTDEKSIRSSTPQTVPDSQCMEVELSNCTDVNFSCLGHYTGPMNGCDCSPSYSCGGGYYSSDSNDEEDCCQPCLQASYTNQTCCAETLNPNNASQVNPKQTLFQPRPLTPLIKSKVNFGDDQKVMENTASPDTAFGSSAQQIRSSMALLLSPQPPPQSSELCRCKKMSIETRDAGTQTAQNPTAETRDASIQCTFVQKTKAASGIYLPPVDVSEQRLATERQSDTAKGPNTLTASSENSRNELKQMPWCNKKSKSGSSSGIMNKFPASNCGKVILQRPTNPFLDALSNGRGKENGEGRDERVQHENPTKTPSEEGKEEVTSGTRVIGLSEEAETLQELADILLLLKQRKKDG